MTRVNSKGSSNASIMLVGDFPGYSEVEKQEPFSGRGGHILRQAASQAGLVVDDCYMTYVSHERPKGDVWSEGDGELAAEIAMVKPKVIIPFGDTALQAVAGIRNGKIGNWHGSQMLMEQLMPLKPWEYDGMPKEEYLYKLRAEPISTIPDSTWIVPSYHPKDVQSQFSWNVSLAQDLARAARLSKDPTQQQVPARQWYFNDLTALQEYAAKLSQPTSHSGFIGFDTENYPYEIVGFATDDAVYVVRFSEKYREVFQEIFLSPFVLKVAHNLQHDISFLYKKLGITVAKPYYDTMGGAWILNNALDKNLSPSIATRYTNWPYHKWMVEYDAEWYNGLDCVVAYDAYQPQLEQLIERDLYNVARHDHALLEPLLDMQWFGFRIDQAEQAKAVEELSADRSGIVNSIAGDVQGIVDERLHRFKKPKLFEVRRKCDCCGGGKKGSQHCWRCGGLSAKPKKKADYAGLALSLGAKYTTKQAAELLPACEVCNHTGKVSKRLEFNPDSAAQVADVLYRGLGIRARKYKGNETVRVGIIEPLADEYPLVKKFVDYARVNAEVETVERLEPGSDGRSHPVFDPWGTRHGRVASREGLIQQGTNAMNIPKKARRLVVPDDGMVFLYPDMKAVEARAIAVISKDKEMIDVFNTAGADMHILVRDDVRRLGFGEFSRDQAKRFEFGTAYGGRPEQMAKELNDEAYRKGVGITNLTGPQVKLMTDVLLTHRFKGVREWHQSVEKQLLATRRLRSITGRESWWTGYIYDKKTKGVSYEVVKEAYSFEPQDIGAWVLGEGMLRAWQNGTWERMRGLIHVHDALLFQARREDIEEAKDVLTRLLSAQRWGMNFEAEMKVGNNWKEAS